MMSIISVEDCGGQLQHLMEKGMPNQKANLFGFNPSVKLIFACMWLKFAIGNSLCFWRCHNQKIWQGP